MIKKTISTVEYYMNALRRPAEATSQVNRSPVAEPRRQRVRENTKTLNLLENQPEITPAPMSGQTVTTYA